MPPDPADLVNAILAVTPFNHDGQVAHEYGCDRPQCCEPVQMGDPRPVAARQAAAARPAVYRELADELEAMETPGKIRLIDARWLRTRADQLDTTNTQETTDA